MTLGGRAAEELVFNEVTTGAANDIEKVTHTAKQMVMRFGMSEKLGPRVLGRNHDMPFLGREMGAEPDYSEEIAREIDDEIRRVIEEAHETARQVLEEHMDELHKLSGILIERETIDKDQFERLLAGEDEDEVFPEEIAAAGRREARRREAQAAAAAAAVPAPGRDDAAPAGALRAYASTAPRQRPSSTDTIGNQARPGTVPVTRGVSRSTSRPCLRRRGRARSPVTCVRGTRGARARSTPALEAASRISSTSFAARRSVNEGSSSFPARIASVFMCA